MQAVMACMAMRSWLVGHKSNENTYFPEVSQTYKGLTKSGVALYSEDIMLIIQYGSRTGQVWVTCVPGLNNPPLTRPRPTSDPPMTRQCTTGGPRSVTQVYHSRPIPDLPGNWWHLTFIGRWQHLTD